MANTNPFKPGDAVEANEGGIFGLVRETTIGGQGHPCVIMLQGHDAKEEGKVRISGIHLLEKKKYPHPGKCAPDRLCGCPDFRRKRACQNPKGDGEWDDDKCCPFLQCGCYWPDYKFNVYAGPGSESKNKRKRLQDEGDADIHVDVDGESKVAKKSRGDAKEDAKVTKESKVKGTLDKFKCKECKRLVNANAFIDEHELCLLCAEKRPDMLFNCRKCKKQVLIQKGYAPIMKMCCECAKKDCDAKICICKKCKQRVHDFDYFDEFSMCTKCADEKGTKYDDDDDELVIKDGIQEEKNKQKVKADKCSKTVGVCWIVEPADCLDDGFRDWLFGEGKHPDSIKRICTLTEEARDAHVQRINIEFAKAFENLLRKRRRGLKYTNKIIKHNVERAKKGKKVILHTNYLIDGLKFKDDNEWCGGQWKSETSAKEFLKFLDLIKADKPITDTEWLLKMAVSYCGEKPFAKYEELPIGQ